MKILVFRSIRPEEMGYVLLDISKKFPNSEITVLTNKQNLFAMQNTKHANRVITYSGNNFEYYSHLKEEISMIASFYYDLIIIPTNGNIETYKNIYNFVKKYLKFKEIKYYVYPNSFLDHPKFNIINLLKIFLQIFVKIFSLPIVLLLLGMFYLFSFLRK